MRDQPLHRVTMTDGATISGSVHGQGVPLVFTHGSLGDGELDRRPLLAHLAGRFTCHLPSRRGRGLTGDHPDHRLGRMLEDIIAYVESTEALAGLVGWSAGATLTLTAAAQSSDRVSAVPVYEPPLRALMQEQQRSARGQAIARMGEQAAQGRLTDAARSWVEFVFKDDEIAALEPAGYLEAAGRYVPVLLEDIQQAMNAGGLGPAEPDVLGRISAPVLVLALHVPDTRPFFTAAARHVADQSLMHGYRRYPAPGTPPR